MNRILMIGNYGIELCYYDLSNYQHLKSFSIITFRFGRYQINYMSDDGYDNSGWKFHKWDVYGD